ncbi:MAG TPA: LamG domain-containing protein, partial [Rhodothermales bacterium]
PNGTIGGRLAAQQGGGTEDALVCLEPGPNRSLLFDGFGGYVEAPVGDEYDISDEFTIEAWIRPHDVTGTRYIVSKDSAYALAINEGVLRLVVFGESTDDVVDASHAPLTAGSWYHVAVSVNDNVTFWVNGLKGGTSPDPPLARIIGDTLTIGQQGDGAGIYKGEIDEVRIWITARDSASIADFRLAPLEGDEENLLGYWPLNDGLRRVSPDVTELANHGRLIDGVYLADEGAPLDVCAVSTNEGNFSISGIRYGDSAEFNLIPSHPTRRFEPSFKKITLTTESPVQNEVTFTDVTAHPVSGFVQYVDVLPDTTLVCPVPDVTIHAEKQPGTTPTDQNVRTTTGVDGSYIVAVDPGIWNIIPTFVHPEDDQLVHTFDPAVAGRVVDEPVSDVNFEDETRHTLSGHFSGGDPDVCGKDIGTALIRIYTQNGCYDRTIEVDSGVDNGAFSVDLPPQEYLMEVDSIYGAPTSLADDIAAFFGRLGSVEVDLTRGDAERNLIFRAPLTLAIAGLEPSNQCSAGITQADEEGNVIRTLPNVPTIGEFGFKQLTISVEENYGDGNTCPVDEGTVTIFDGIADRADADSTMDIENGQVQYTTFGASPNIISGARVGGVDRSFQKPLTVIARVEGREPLTETLWALVEGFRERASTFVSAATSEFPLLVLHDPPGGESSSFIERGTSFCSSVESVRMVSGGAGPDIDVAVGFKLRGGFSGFGSHFTSEFGAGVLLATRTIIGAGAGDMWDENEDGIANDNFEICMSTTENLATSTDPGWAGEDIHMGVALNLIFALADVLEFDDSACEINLSETLATDLDMAKPFETTYVYGESHISGSLIPELENLIELAGGDATVEGELNGDQAVIRLDETLQNWTKQLEDNDKFKVEALKNPQVNRSFSGGTEFSYSEEADTTEVVRLETRSLFIDTDNAVGVVITAGAYDQKLAMAFEIRAEWEHEESDTEGRSRTVGYVLHEEDAGDYFSVDIARDPRFGTFVFGTRSGRSSGFCEANTQCRDNPLILSVDPPVLFNVDPAEGGNFEVSLANASESNERRQYILAAPATTNPKNLSISAGGGVLGEKQYLIEPGTAVTVNVGVRPGPSAWAYENVALTFFSEADRVVWEGDTRLDFEAADSAFFSVFFDSTGGNAMATPMAEGWTWFSVNREGGNVNQVLSTIPAHHGDLLRGQTAEAQFDSTGGWTGALRTLVPGAGYRIRLQQPTVFRITGEAVDEVDPIKLEPGWNWVGYLPAKRLSVDDALESLSDKVQQGDLVVGQRSFAQYVSGKGWIGSLDAMAPGESYTISLARGGELRYPTDVENAVRPTITATERTVNGPGWSIHPERFDAAMTMVAEVQHKGTMQDRTTTRVAVFAGDSLRGVGDIRYVEPLGRYMTFVMIYGGP